MSAASPDGGPPRNVEPSDAAPAVLSNAPAPGVDHDAISEEIRRQFEVVPPIGTRWRWYDIPYRAIHWLLRSRVRRFLPWRVRHLLNRWINFLMTFEHYDRLKIERLDNPMDNLIVPEDESVTQGGLWVVEFFPPSQYANLLTSMEENGWDKEKQLNSIDGSNAEQVTQARRGRGFVWSRIGSVTNPDSGFPAFDAKRERLPREFSYIDLTAVQVGHSLTAVVAFVRMSDEGSHALNTVWKATHEPYFEWRGLSRPMVENRYFAAIRATQRERQRIHDLARDWLGERCGGFFAGTEAGQTVVDFNLFTDHDPLDWEQEREVQDPLRALSMDANVFLHYVSPQIPGMVFVPGEALRRPKERLQNCWALVGNREKVSDLAERPGYGDKPYSPGTLAAMFDDGVRSFILYEAVLQYINQMRATYSHARDMARVRHERFKAQKIERLSEELLTNSLDLPVVARDSELLWQDRYRRWSGIDVQAVSAPDSSNPREPFDYIERLGEARRESFEALLQEDVAYRDVLSTVTSLGASVEQYRLGQRALLVAVGSLVVSLVAMLLATGDPSAAERIFDWLKAL